MSSSRPSPGDRDRILWAAWRVTRDGEIEVSASLRRDEDEVTRELWTFPSLEEASEALDPGFGDVVRRVLAAGRSQGRWRP